jgi:CheY-like chemotaxis protein
VTKVLYIEHDDDNLYMLKMRLERVGDFEVLAAEDSEKGCKLALTELDALELAFATLLVDDGDPLGIRKEDADTDESFSTCGPR